MARNGSGVYVLPAGQPVVTGSKISSAAQNMLMTDISTALTTSLATDGQTAMSANLPMGNNKITGLSAGTVATDAITLSPQHWIYGRQPQRPFCSYAFLELSESCYDIT